MKLLLFSDLHANAAAASKLVALSKVVDIVVVAGDFGNIRRNVSVCIDALCQISVPAVLVAGNNESHDELVAVCKKWTSAVVLHGDGREICGLPFYGIGGGIPVTPFGDWSFDFSETEAETLLTACPPNGVLVSHSPPKWAVDVSSSGSSLGSIAVRDATIRTKPRLVVCGHIHGSEGKTTFIGRTPVVNAGPAGIIWTI